MLGLSSVGRGKESVSTHISLLCLKHTAPYVHSPLFSDIAIPTASKGQTGRNSLGAGTYHDPVIQELAEGPLVPSTSSGGSQPVGLDPFRSP